MSNNEIARPNYEKYILFPIKHDNIYKLFKTQIEAFWTVDEIDIVSDLRDWHNKLTHNEKEYIKYILAFFAASDGIVIDNIAKRFYNEIPNSEGAIFYAFQMGMEAIHSQLYSLLIDVYINKAEDKEKLFNAVTELPVIKDKADWAIRWTEDENASLAQRIFAFAIVEGVFFSGAFCSIYWLKDRGVMPGLSLSNDFISRDEGLHMMHACMQYLLLPDKLPLETVYEMVEDAIEVEERFIREALKYKLGGMNADLMVQYIKYTADRLLTLIECEKLYGVENPFDFMNKISMNAKENFFEQRNGQYKKYGIMSNEDIKNLHKLNYKYEEEKELGGGVELLLEFAKDNNINENIVNDWLEKKKEKGSDTRFNKLELSDDF